MPIGMGRRRAQDDLREERGGETMFEISQIRCFVAVAGEPHLAEPPSA